MLIFRWVDITGLCWSPNNDFFASTSIDNAVGIWSVADGSTIYHYDINTTH
jgi:WD40 repeat protein